MASFFEALSLPSGSTSLKCSITSR
ncbi:MAG: hypothetical protein EOM37_01830 [Proteobacteria bacterium]|nr:hypothetical protein [Pseudomonadota bacterium]